MLVGKFDEARLRLYNAQTQLIIYEDELDLSVLAVSPNEDFIVLVDPSNQVAVYDVASKDM